MGDRRFDPVSLVLGLAFVGLAITWLVGDDDLYGDVARFVAPLTLIAIGLAVLARRDRTLD